jgi:hypothetical protein
MVDNRQGKGYRGSIDSKFISSYIPQGISSEKIFLLLAGRLIDNQEPVDIVSVTGDGGENYYRYSFIIASGYTLYSEININSGLLSRQFIMDKNGKGKTIIAVDYAGSLPIGNYCHLPLTLEVEGEAITGAVGIVVDKVYGNGGNVLDDRVFLLKIPEHFTVKSKY